ncbi:MAG: hypothetical protein ASARMPRED_001447 [Alectoria sarmentosa]|nr:MAG: hypothetical protein ASARMPRED_001447 [Alectoria sarmentosa]
MDLFAKDHPLEAAALRAQGVKPKLRTFEFEELPSTARHRIYRELLLKPKRNEDHSAAEDNDSYASEDEKLSERIEWLMIEIGEGDNQMHPEIMRTNRNIHNEAAAVLYGENWFTWGLYGDQYRPMWRSPEAEKIECPRHYSRLVTKMRLMISTKGDENDPTQSDAIYWTITNVKHACKKLTLNDFKILKVDFYNALGYRYGGSARKGYYGESCLEPLKRCRAEKFLINGYASPAYAAKLKAEIEGPKGARFRAYRKAKEEEPESDYDDPLDVGDEDSVDLSDDITVEGEYEDKAEAEDSRMEGLETTSN